MHVRSKVDRPALSANGRRAIMRRLTWRHSATWPAYLDCRARALSVASSSQPPPATTTTATTMSSITFPNGGRERTASTSSSIHDDAYFSSSFESAVGSSFQMNPLSQHPPRTPRTSIISGSHVYGGDIYTPKEEVIEQRGDLLAEEDEVEAVPETVKARVKPVEVWRELVKTSYGRDKAFVRVHAVLCLVVWFDRHVRRNSYNIVCACISSSIHLWQGHR